MFNLAREFAYEILIREANNPESYRAEEDLDFYREGVKEEYIRIKARLNNPHRLRFV